MPFRYLEKRGEIFKDLPTPAYIIDEDALLANGEILKALREKTGCKILLAQKAFSNYAFYPLLSKYLDGTEASGLYEARLGKEEMGEHEVHVFCGAYREEEFDELLTYADHLVFNSPTQLTRFGARAKAQHKSIGLRINPEYSTQSAHAIYDPCAPGSRLGATFEVFSQMDEETFNLLDGLHFHTLCEQNSDDLVKTWQAFENRFSPYLHLLKWLNMGGGHHITRDDYDRETLERLITYIQETYDLQVYLEPGEAIALNAGYLITRVLDLVDNHDMKIAILDTSAACHMPDVIEMPYRPPLLQEASGYPYRLGSQTCLAGDIIGDYSFDHPLKIGEILVFGDMAIYTTCKNNTFNGMPLPAIYRLQGSDLSLWKNFTYEDFKSRL